MIFSKYHGLGNDYIVIDPERETEKLTESRIRRICHRNYGIGSDGILWGPFHMDPADTPAVRIFNPDGSEAEKSGNGLRIFARYLYDRGAVSEEAFVISTAGGNVTARVLEGGRGIAVEMGRVSFDSREIPVEGDPREVIDEPLEIDGERLVVCCATIGNPHCVIFEDNLHTDRVKALGPKIENHPMFPRRTNVQFARVADEKRIDIEIWERGAGYTLASGSSASATAAVARRLGLCAPEVSVYMPGGILDITIGPDYDIFMSGPVTRIAEGTLYNEMFEEDSAG